MTGAKDGGFTLVEALVSLFVFSLIASGCVAMLMQSVDSQRRVGEAHEALRELQTARALLSADAAQVVRRTLRGADGSRKPGFIGGDADHPLLLVRAGAGTTGGGAQLAAVNYAFRDGAVVRVTSANLETFDPQAEGRVILSNITEPRFQFYDGARWHDQWGDAAGGGALPRAVALVAKTARYGDVRIEAVVGLGS